MTIEPARDVRRVTADETAWFVAGALLIVAGLATAVSVIRQWSLCGADSGISGLPGVASRP